MVRICRIIHKFPTAIDCSSLYHLCDPLLIIAPQLCKFAIGEPNLLNESVHVIPMILAWAAGKTGRSEPGDLPIRRV